MDLICKKITATLLLIMLTSPATAEEVGVIESWLILAKLTGMCGTFQQMANFQLSTQMPGGTEFVERFVKTEAARLGRTDTEFLKQCEDATASYTTLIESARKAKISTPPSPP